MQKLLLAPLIVLLAACAANEEIAPVGGAEDLSVSEDWDCQQQTMDDWECYPAQKEPEPVPQRAQTLPASEPVAEEMSEPPALDWILQVGAFKDEASARRAVAEIGLDSLQVAPVMRDGEQWFILLAGRFASRVDAREAGEDYLDDYPDGRIWVREASELTWL